MTIGDSRNKKQQRAAVEETDAPIREIGHIGLGPGGVVLLPFVPLQR
jgi:hypothetical protein